MVGAPSGEVNKADPPPAVRMVNYDAATGEDDAGAIQNARDVKLPFNKNDIQLWFTLIESKMQFAGLKKQWSKRQVLIQLIPPEYHSDLKQYLILQEDAAGDLPYKTLKDAIVKLLGPKSKADGYDRAVGRVMTGSPSQLGRQIMNDICPEVNPLAGCHCAGIVLGIWRKSLPTVVRNHIADMEFSAATFKQIFDSADNVWASNGAVSVAAVTGNNSQEVAAASRGGRGAARPRGNRGNRGGAGRGGGSGTQGGGTQGGGQRNQDRGPRHQDGPPSNACRVHWLHGKGAWFCADRHSCPWRDFESPRPRHNRNIVAGAEIVD